jgi:hypothetical protein
MKISVLFTWHLPWRKTKISVLSVHDIYTEDINED